MGRLVDMVVAFRLEEEMPALAAHHRDQPGDHRGGHQVIGEQSEVGSDEAERAHQVQRLIDTTVMVVPMVVPTLGPQCLQETLHLLCPVFQCLKAGM